MKDQGIMICPSCGEAYDTEEYSACSCGATIKRSKPMTNYEQQYKDETGEDIRPLDDLTREWTIITGKYYRWLIQTADALRVRAERSEEEAAFWKSNYRMIAGNDLQYWHERCRRAEAERDELIRVLNAVKKFYDEVGIFSWDDI